MAKDERVVRKRAGKVKTATPEQPSIWPVSPPLRMLPDSAQRIGRVEFQLQFSRVQPMEAERVMGKLGEPRIQLIVESYLPASTSGKHGEVHVRPAPGQGFDTNLLVRCNKGIHRHRPIGTRFRITAMLTANKEGAKYFSSHPSWKYEVLND